MGRAMRMMKGDGNSLGQITAPAYSRITKGRHLFENRGAFIKEAQFRLGNFGHPRNAHV